MKKYIFICLLACVNLCYAQQTKPTKEQTVDFISKTVIEGKGTKDRTGSLVTSQDFDDTIWRFSKKFTTSSGNTLNAKIYDIKWQNLIIDSFKRIPTEDTEIVHIEVEFTSKMETIYNNDYSEPFFTNHLSILIPKSKYESMKKAFLRLAEIAKEENKDPFAN